MHQSCFLKIGISQVWVDGFQISQSLWVREALGHILNLSRRHNSCKQNFCVTKSPKIHLFFQFHITGTVCSIIYFYIEQFELIVFSEVYSPICSFLMGCTDIKIPPMSPLSRDNFSRFHGSFNTPKPGLRALSYSFVDAKKNYP